MIAAAIAVLVLLGSAIQVGYGIYFFLRIQNADAADDATSSFPATLQHPLSVLICAKNEAHNLRAYLPFILDQHYFTANRQPFFEVVVVNDQSEDETGAVLEALQTQYAHLKVVTIHPSEYRSLPGKKFALSKGVAAVAHEYIVLTDADCKPATVDWLHYMSQPFATGKEIVAGYGGFFSRKGFLNVFIRCETLHTYLQYLTYNLADIPYMAVGRNLAVHKALLLRAQEHLLWKVTASGDDDLLIQLCATKNNMAVQTHPPSFTYSAPPDTWRKWVKQKQRHFSTGKLYKKKVQLLLGGYAFSHALSWLGLLLWFMPPTTLSMVALTAMGIRLLFTWYCLNEMSLRTRENNLFICWPLFDIGWLLYNFIFAPFIFWKNKQQWK